jgi:hypothetical protein
LRRQDFTLLGAPEPRYLLCDVTLAVIALGLRRGAFKNYNSWESLAQGKEYHIEWREDVLDKPFFVVCGHRGLVFDYDRPMTDDSARRYLHRQAIASGLGGITLHAFFMTHPLNRT